MVAANFSGRKIIAVSNCEPYTHFRSDGRLACAQPASGLVSAVDPILRASGGVWVAAGDGDPDRAAVDALDHVRVPPDDPEYTLRRVWLAPELRREYYYGLANETIWPVCHVAFHRPRFSEKCWKSYRRVNEIFADAVLEEAAGCPGVVLVQDYHFALLPRILKERNPRLKVAQFWHIPWPAPETIRILPWRREFLRGLLGNDLIGFHLREHCDSFLAAAAQMLGASVDLDARTVAWEGRTTAVRPFPISIDFAAHARAAASQPVADAMAGWLDEIGPAPAVLGVGIDRIDYTKGIPERLDAIDLLLREHPEHLGRLVFVQIGVPSRSGIPGYHALQDEIAAQVAEINARWGMRGWKPIVYITRKVDRQKLVALHLLADFCVVSSLHDGMNLVAKEFVASRIDEDGVLVLSEFAGAAGELTDALIVNPYSPSSIARAIDDAICMEPGERRRRMSAMRRTVAFNNVYNWGSDFLAALAQTGRAGAEPAPGQRAAELDGYERRIALSA